uniref:RING-type domain-containing protein n=1 Tax=viral metagenome TaxID=1070528 RepID=A0A6C0JCA8_9ZZZZ
MNVLERNNIIISDNHDVYHLKLNHSDMIDQISYFLKNKNSPNVINQALKTFINSRNSLNKPFYKYNHNTRNIEKYNNEIEIKINILENYGEAIYNIEYAMSFLFPLADKYINRYTIKSVDEPIILYISGNDLFIKGGIIGIYRFLLTRQIFQIIEDLKNRPYTLDEYYKHIKNYECKGEDLGDCVICLSEIQKGNIVSTTSCNHHFHYHCLFKWLVHNSTPPSCPCCRKIQNRGS